MLLILVMEAIETKTWTIINTPSDDANGLSREVAERHGPDWQCNVDVSTWRVMEVPRMCDVHEAFSYHTLAIANMLQGARVEAQAELIHSALSSAQAAYPCGCRTYAVFLRSHNVWAYGPARVCGLGAENIVVND